MKSFRFFLIGFIALALSLGFAGCNMNSPNGDSPFFWRAAYNFYEEGEGIPGLNFGLVTDEDDEEGSLVFDEEDFLSAAYGNGIIVIGGAFSGKIVYSADKGETWNAVDSGLNYGITSIAYTNGIFVAGGETAEGEGEEEILNNFFSVSSNGSDWNLVSAEETFPRPYVLSAGETFFNAPYRFKNFVFSNDGSNWAGCEDDDSTYWPKYFKGIAYGNGTHVLVGDNKGSTKSGSAIISYSKDGGANWANANFSWAKSGDDEPIWASPFEIGNEASDNYGDILSYVYDVAYGDGTFVATGRDYSETLEYEDWEMDDKGNIVYINEEYIKSPYQFPDGMNANIIISSDGINWIRKDSGTNVDALGFGAGTFVGLNSWNDATLDSPSIKAVYSTDKGVTWKPAKGNFDSYVFKKIVYGGGYFIAPGFTYKYVNNVYTISNNTMFYSEDFGRTWKAIRNKFDSLITDILYADGVFIAVSENGKIYIAKVQ